MDVDSIICSLPSQYQTSSVIALMHAMHVLTKGIETARKPKQHQQTSK